MDLGKDVIFAIQCDFNSSLALECEELIRILKRPRMRVFYSYDLVESNNVNKYIEDNTGNKDKVCPVGDIEFVQHFLDSYHGVSRMNPIEIPLAMRTEYYLGRKYQIVHKNDLKESGFCFIKDVTRLKNFTCSRLLTKEAIVELPCDIVQVSDYVEFISEYRVFALRGVIEAVQHYTGEPNVFPDSEFIESAVKEYFSLDGHSNAVTLDVGVLANGRTVLIEIHTFVSCGTYGYRDDTIVKMYIEGYKYVVNSNKELETGYLK